MPVRAFIVVAALSSARPAFAEEPPPDALRWEGGIGVGLYSLPLREQRFGGEGLFLAAGMRFHAVGVSVEYRWLDVDWDGGTQQGGRMQRVALVGRYNVALCCSESGKRDTLTLVVDAGAAHELIDWSGGGELARNSRELGVALRAGMRRGALEPVRSLFLCDCLKGKHRESSLVIGQAVAA